MPRLEGDVLVLTKSRRREGVDLNQCLTASAPQYLHLNNKGLGLD